MSETAPPSSSRNTIDRPAIAARRLALVLEDNVVSNARTLEQKISDAGPGHMRVDPHILTPVLRALVKNGTIARQQDTQTGVWWYYLSRTPLQKVHDRLNVLTPIHRSIINGAFLMRMGQTLEIATYRALLEAKKSFMGVFGGYADLDAHDDSRPYRRVEPPVMLNGLSSGNPLDYLVQTVHGPLGIEVKNTREWLYPDRPEVRDLLEKACALDALPVLIGRRVPFVTRKLLTTCGALVHETYNQLFPEADTALADEARHKTKLGYHDIRVGNVPDARLLKFIGTDMPDLVERSREIFETYKDLLSDFGTGHMEYAEFAARVRRRSQGFKEDNDWPDPEPDTFDF